MANEYQFYHVGAEVLSTGLPNAPILIYSLHPEIVRTLRIGFNPSFIDDLGDEVLAPKFLPAFSPRFVNASEEFTVWPISFLAGDAQASPSISSSIEWNPYRPNLAGTPVEEYLDEQAGIIREQHNKAQAGDTTFDVARLLKTSTLQEFTLGSLGRFYTEDNGLILARYVRFSGMLESQRNPAPVGRLATSESVDWTVTNDFTKSGRDLAVGIGFYEAVPLDGSFGWAVTHGPNPFALTAQTEVIPSQNAPYSWTDTGKVGLASRGNVVCRRWGRAFGYGIGAGTVFICVEQLGPSELIWTIEQQMAESVAALAALEGRVTTSEALLATHTTQITSLTQTDAALLLRIEREESIRARETQNLRNLIDGGADFTSAINSAMNTVRSEFATQDDLIRARLAEVSRIANQAYTWGSGLDGLGINATLDALTVQLGGIITRLAGVNFNLAGMVAQQGIKAVATGTDSLGNTLFEFQPVTLAPLTRKYNLPIAFTSAPAANEIMMIHTFTQTVDFADEWGGSVGYVGTNPAATFVFTLAKIVAGVPTTVGTISISSAGAITFATTDTTVQFVAGDTLRVTAQAGVDTIANTCLTLQGNTAV